MTKRRAMTEKRMLLKLAHDESYGAYGSSFVHLSSSKVLFHNSPSFFLSSHFYVKKHGNSNEEVIMWAVREDEKWKFMLFDSNCRCHCHCSMKIPFIYCMIHFSLTLVPFLCPIGPLSYPFITKASRWKYGWRKRKKCRE